MPVLILLGYLTVWGAVEFCNSCSKNAQAYSKSELEKIANEMIGKSQREARRILRNHRKY